MVLLNSGIDRFSDYKLRRSPVTGPILSKVFKGILTILAAGAGLTVLFMFNTGSPLNDMVSPPLPVYGIMALLLSPYVGLFSLSWYLTGGSIWRGMAALLGTLAVTGYGLYHVLDFWFFKPRPIQGQALIIFPLEQWAGLVAVTIVAVVPGMIFYRFVDRAISKVNQAQTPPPGDSA